MGKTSSRRLAAVHHIQARQYQGSHFTGFQLHISVSKGEGGYELSLGWKVGIYLAGEHTSVSIFFFLSLKNVCKRRHFQKNSGSWQSFGIQNVLERWILEVWGIKCARHLTPCSAPAAWPSLYVLGLISRLKYPVSQQNKNAPSTAGLGYGKCLFL